MYIVTHTDKVSNYDCSQGGKLPAKTLSALIPNLGTYLTYVHAALLAQSLGAAMQRQPPGDGNAAEEPL